MSVTCSVAHRDLGQGQQLNSCYWLSKKNATGADLVINPQPLSPTPPAVQTSLLKTDCICVLVARIVWVFCYFNSVVSEEKIPQ